jgi:hypothetical protein
VLNEAVPLMVRGIWARTVAPSWKVTIPDGIVGPGGADVTVAVKVTACPKLDGFGDELSVALDALAWTFWTRVAFPPLKLASPL